MSHPLAYFFKEFHFLGKFCLSPLRISNDAARTITITKLSLCLYFFGLNVNGLISLVLTLKLSQDGLPLDTFYTASRDAYTSTKTDELVFLGGIGLNGILAYVLAVLLYRSRHTIERFNNQSLTNLESVKRTEFVQVKT